jgi:hypothetical protein
MPSNLWSPIETPFKHTHAGGQIARAALTESEDPGYPPILLSPFLASFRPSQFPPLFESPPVMRSPNSRIPTAKARRRPFTKEEDQLMKKLVSELGTPDWKRIAEWFTDRTARQCRERYSAYLAPQINNGPWEESEDRILRQKFAELGPKWAKMAQFFNGRSDTSLRNRWAALNAKDSARPKPEGPLMRRTEPPPIGGEVTDSTKTFRNTHPLLQGLWGLNITAAEWDSPESQLERQELQKTFINYGGNAW